MSSAIFLAALLVFINCKNNAGDAVGKNDSNDSVKTFYESIIKLGNGFIDVFNAFSGLVADTFFKADPKKSDVKIYFESISKTLTETKNKLGEKLGSSAGKGENSSSGKASVKSAVDEVSKWLEEMITAAGDAATKGGTGGNNEKIGDAANKGAVADAGSVRGIAKGIKGIVDAAGKAFGGDALAGVAKVADDAAGANANAGKLFAGANGGAAADAAEIAKAAGAVSAVSGEQILKAIVDAAGDKANQAGAAAGAEAKNPIAAAIGTDDAGAAFNDDGMKKRNDKIAAAIVLRGVAKGGKFAAAANDGKKESVKSAVESAVDEVKRMVRRDDKSCW
ncbi:variable large family protein [Borreliella afzelii]|uniref:variable large family protein n=1 Tax=Borreliella afzelii TaxID=29518 RepID=UPI003BF5560F